MKTKYAGAAKASGLNHLQEGLSKKLLAVFRSLTRPAATQHVGMFAGSLLTYDSWSQPKVPH
jgi:hypothetical protein